MGERLISNLNIIATYNSSEFNLQFKQKHKKRLIIITIL
ncbi:hypothetical protein CRD_00385 [Raphidiopsis brookii D9]|nr:hypothetical protein CRD_00385 [Raphidiopsis brookii D9]